MLSLPLFAIAGMVVLVGASSAGGVSHSGRADDFLDDLAGGLGDIFFFGQVQRGNDIIKLGQNPKKAYFFIKIFDIIFIA